MEHDRIPEFIQSFDPGNTEFLNDLEERAKRDDIPVIRPAAQNLLKLMLELKHPGSILEVGAAIGFSAVLMAQYSDPATRITTIEKYEKRLGPLKDNILASGFKDRIRVLEGDALKILKELSDEGASFDFIFMDAAKGQYLNFLPYVIKLLPAGGVLISDNVLQGGDIIESRFAVERRNRTIHSRMREYLYRLTNTEEFITSIFPIADGMTVSIRRGNHSVSEAD